MPTPEAPRKNILLPENLSGPVPGVVPHQVDMSFQYSDAPGIEKLEFSVAGNLFERASEILRKRKGLVLTVSAGLVVTGVAVGVGMLVKRHLDEKRERESTQIILPLDPIKPKEFERVYDENATRIFGFIFGLTGNADAAHDLTQRVFFNAYNKLSGFKPRPDIPNPERSWLFTIARNLVKNYYRDEQVRSRNTVSESLEDIEKSGRAVTIFSYSDKKEKVPEEFSFFSQALSELNSDGKILFWLKFIEELADKDIAYIMGKTLSATKVRVHRLRKRLAKKMQESETQ